VYDCFSPRALAAFYEELLGMRTRKQDSEHWVLIAREDGSLPMLAFQHAQVTAPRWPDPAYPQQLHLDLHVDDSTAAQELALRLGAIRLPPRGGSCPVFADPAAHPFCLCAPGQ
jgi:catechol 2,3-dioxygenase-like lactoylglutathione lyase family enzyme